MKLRILKTILPIVTGLAVSFSLVTQVVLAWQKDGGATCQRVFASIKNESHTRQWDGYVKANNAIQVSNSGNVSPNQWVTISWTPPANFNGSVEAYIRINNNGHTEDDKKVTATLHCGPSPSPSPYPTPIPSVSPSPSTEPSPIPSPYPSSSPSPDDKCEGVSCNTGGGPSPSPSLSPSPSISPSPQSTPSASPDPSPSGGGSSSSGGSQTSSSSGGQVLGASTLAPTGYGASSAIFAIALGMISLGLWQAKRSLLRNAA